MSNKGSKHSTVAGRRAEIRDAAALLFEKHGFYNTTMEMIADQVQIQKPTLYYYVKSKGQLVAWIHDRICDEFIDRLDSSVAEGRTTTECIQQVIHHVFETFATRPGHLKVYFENHQEIPVEYQEISRGKRDAYYARVKSLVTDGITSGIFRGHDPELATLALFGMCNWSYQWYRSSGPQSPGEVSAAFWQIISQGLLKDPPSASLN